MKYIFKNFKSFRKNQPVFLLLIIISVFATSMMINFSFGIYCNYRERKLSEIRQLRNIQMHINESAQINKSDLENCLLYLPEDLENLIDGVYVSMDIDDNLSIECQFALKNGKYIPAAAFRDNLLKANFINNYFTIEQEQNGELVALIYKESKEQSDFHDEINGFIEIQSKTYKVIGYQSWTIEEPILPFASLNQDTRTNAEEGIYLHFSRAISKQEYDDLYRIFNDNFGDLIEIPQIPFVHGQDQSVYNTMMLIAIGIAVTAAVNFAILFKYIMMQRDKMLAVYRICGLTKIKAVVLYLMECVFIIVPIYIGGSVCFNYIMLPLLSKMVGLSGTIYSIRAYLLLFLSYIIISVILLVVIIYAEIYRKNIVDSV